MSGKERAILTRARWDPMGGGAGGGRGAGGDDETPRAPPPFKAGPMHIKYRAYTQGDDPSVDLKVRRIQMARDWLCPLAALAFFFLAD